jgi:hypothetical protein
MRKRHDVLLEADGRPGAANGTTIAPTAKAFQSAERSGKPPLRFEPDAIIHDALTMAAAGFLEHREYFDVPVTRTQAHRCMISLIGKRRRWVSVYDAAARFPRWSPREV